MRGCLPLLSYPRVRAIFPFLFLLTNSLDNPDPSGLTAVEVVPVQGTLSPGETRICRVIFRPGIHVGFFEIDVPCHVSYTPPQPPPPKKTDDSEIFVQNLTYSRHISPTKKLANGNIDTATIGGNTMKRDGMFPPLSKTHPPIQTTHSATTSNAHTLHADAHPPNTATNNSIPSIVTTTLFLTLQARTIPTAQYRHEYGAGTIMPASVPKKLLPIIKPGTPPPLLSPKSQLQMQQISPLSLDDASSLVPLASSFLSSLVAEILADPDVQEEARKHSDSDIIPYFVQLKDDDDTAESDSDKEKPEKDKERRLSAPRPKLERSNSRKISATFRDLKSIEVTANMHA